MLKKGTNQKCSMSMYAIVLVGLLKKRKKELKVDSLTNNSLAVIAHINLFTDSVLLWWSMAWFNIFSPEMNESIITSQRIVSLFNRVGLCCVM
jgi:hypothetical protein